MTTAEAKTLVELLAKHRTLPRPFLRRNLSYSVPVPFDDHSAFNFVELKFKTFRAKLEPDADKLAGQYGVNLFAAITSRHGGRLLIHSMARCTVAVKVHAKDVVKAKEQLERESVSRKLPISSSVRLRLAPNLPNAMLLVGVVSGKHCLHELVGNPQGSEGCPLSVSLPVFSTTPELPFYGRVSVFPVSNLKPRERMLCMALQPRLMMASMLSTPTEYKQLPLERQRAYCGPRAAAPVRCSNGEMVDYIDLDPELLRDLNCGRYEGDVVETQVVGSTAAQGVVVNVIPKLPKCYLDVGFVDNDHHKHYPLMNWHDLSGNVLVTCGNRKQAPQTPANTIVLDYRNGRNESVLRERCFLLACPICNMACHKVAALVVHINSCHPGVSAAYKESKHPTIQACIHIRIDLPPHMETLSILDGPHRACTVSYCFWKGRWNKSMDHLKQHGLSRHGLSKLARLQSIIALQRAAWQNELTSLVEDPDVSCPLMQLHFSQPQLRYECTGPLPPDVSKRHRRKQKAGVRRVTQSVVSGDSPQPLRQHRDSSQNASPSVVDLVRQLSGTPQAHKRSRECPSSGDTVRWPPAKSPVLDAAHSKAEHRDAAQLAPRAINSDLQQTGHTAILPPTPAPSASLSLSQTRAIGVVPVEPARVGSAATAQSPALGVYCVESAATRAVSPTAQPPASSAAAATHTPPTVPHMTASANAARLPQRTTGHAAVHGSHNNTIGELQLQVALQDPGVRSLFQKYLAINGPAAATAQQAGLQMQLQHNAQPGGSQNSFSRLLGAIQSAQNACVQDAGLVAATGSPVRRTPGMVSAASLAESPCRGSVEGAQEQRRVPSAASGDSDAVHRGKSVLASAAVLASRAMAPKGQAASVLQSPARSPQGQQSPALTSPGQQSPVQTSPTARSPACLSPAHTSPRDMSPARRAKTPTAKGDHAAQAAELPQRRGDTQAVAADLDMQELSQRSSVRGPLEERSSDRASKGAELPNLASSASVGAGKGPPSDQPFAASPRVWGSDAAPVREGGASGAEEQAPSSPTCVRRDGARDADAGASQQSGEQDVQRDGSTGLRDSSTRTGQEPLPSSSALEPSSEDEGDKLPLTGQRAGRQQMQEQRQPETFSGATQAELEDDDEDDDDQDTCAVEHGVSTDDESFEDGAAHLRPKQKKWNPVDKEEPRFYHHVTGAPLGPGSNITDGLIKRVRQAEQESLPDQVMDVWDTLCQRRERFSPAAQEYWTLWNVHKQDYRICSQGMLPIFLETFTRMYRHLLLQPDLRWHFVAHIGHMVQNDQIKPWHALQCVHVLNGRAMPVPFHLLEARDVKGEVPGAQAASDDEGYGKAADPVGTDTATLHA